MIAWSRSVGMKYCPTLPGSRQCYKLFINHILRLYVKSFIPARWDPFFVLPGSFFAGTKFYHVISSAYLRGTKKLINTYVYREKFLKRYTNLNKYEVENCPPLLRWSLISSCNPRVKSVGCQFHPGKLRSCNHHLIQVNSLGSKVPTGV